MNFSEILLVGSGGFLGSIARYFVMLGVRSAGIQKFPYATLVVNVLGCLLAGIIVSLAEKNWPHIHRWLVPFGAVGFLASFTTFSTFSVEVLQLWQNESYVNASLNILLNLILGFGATLLGRSLIG